MTDSDRRLLQFISYPKCGRSWLRYALHQLGRDGEVHFHHDGFEFNDASRPPLDFDFPARLQRYQSAGQIVYMSREPRDVLVSGYFQITGRFADIFDFRGTISDYIRDPYFGAVSLHIFRDQWAELCRRGVALHVTYEQCHGDFEGVLAKVTKHFGWDIAPADLALASRRSSFSEMQRVERSASFPEPWLRLRNGAAKVRAGRRDGYLAYLDREDCEYLDRVFGPPSAKPEPHIPA